ncbi:hypothetical protein GCM10018963_64760 [Saccharothrix longispora]
MSAASATSLANSSRSSRWSAVTPATPGTTSQTRSGARFHTASSDRDNGEIDAAIPKSQAIRCASPTAPR